MKKLIDAIVDAEAAAAKLAEEASAIGAKSGKAMNEFTRKLLLARQMGTINKDRARELYVIAFSGYSLAGFVQMAQKVADHGEEVTVSISKENKRLGPEATKIPNITKAHFLARELEKANGSE